jgi:hypothetical protein
MLSRTSILFTAGAMFVAAAADAGCNCNKGGGSAVSVGPVYTGASLGPAPVYGAPAYPSGGMMAAPGYGGEMPMAPSYPTPTMSADPYSAVLGPGAATSGMMMGTIAPPPGTLGQTYQRSSRPVPADKHPRAGMLDVSAPGAIDVAVYDTENYRLEDRIDGFRDQDNHNVWHFEEKTMIPGLPHIYRVVARKTRDGQFEERYVRLIMGRVVSVEF